MNSWKKVGVFADVGRFVGDVEIAAFGAVIAGVAPRRAPAVLGDPAARAAVVRDAVVPADEQHRVVHRVGGIVEIQGVRDGAVTVEQVAPGDGRTVADEQGGLDRAVQLEVLLQRAGRWHRRTGNGRPAQPAVSVLAGQVTGHDVGIVRIAHLEHHAVTAHVIGNPQRVAAGAAGHVVFAVLDVVLRKVVGSFTATQQGRFQIAGRRKGVTGTAGALVLHGGDISQIAAIVSCGQHLRGTIAGRRQNPRIQGNRRRNESRARRLTGRRHVLGLGRTFEGRFFARGAGDGRQRDERYQHHRGNGLLKLFAMWSQSWIHVR